MASEPRPEAQLVLCQRVSMRWQVSRGQSQGGATHKGLVMGAYFPKGCHEQNELSQMSVVAEHGMFQKWVRVLGGTCLVSGATQCAESQS